MQFVRSGSPGIWLYAMSGKLFQCQAQCAIHWGVALSNRLDASVFALTGFYRESLHRPRTRAAEVAW
jgi:hypothetical protein